MIVKRALFSGLALVGLAAGIAVAPQTASAATDGLPDGSWRQTCDRAYVKDGTLHAACRRDGGKSVFASAQIGSCQAFGNRNGTLFCESGDGGSQNVNQWRGSFSQTCRDISMDSSGTLTATCQTTNGTWNRSSLSPRQCGNNYQAGNRNGTLFCER